MVTSKRFEAIFALIVIFGPGMILLIEVENQGLPPLEILPNVSYGTDPQQIMDVYLPIGRNQTVSKIVVLIHGGSWSGGEKEDMNDWVDKLYQGFPQHAIANIDYRLGTIQSPGFPKQIEDISAVIKFLKSKADEYSVSPKFALFGTSAGAHLAMLYGYRFDTAKDVRVICNQLGISNLADPVYTENREYFPLGMPLLGNYSYPQDLTLLASVSPVTFITPDSPKTISFYGDKDFLAPITQGTILEDKLDSVGVYNKYYLYPGGHGDWSEKDYAHMNKKIFYFFKNYL